MSDGDPVHEVPTRRACVKYGGAIVGGGLLAGCTGGDIEEPSGTASAGTESSDDESTEQTDTSYSVSIEPVGDVEFDSVPETWVAGNGSWADMGVALGLEPPEGLWIPGRYPTQFYDDIDGLSVDGEEITALWDDGVSKELFYELDADVHVFDPNFLVNRFDGWERSDVDEISENIAPVFGNTSFTRGYEWHDDYRYYSMYEAFSKLAEVFRREERYEAFVELHHGVQDSIRDILPPEDERPEIGLVFPMDEEPDEFWGPYRLEDGTGYKQWRDLGVNDAFDGSGLETFVSSRGTLDYETLLEYDPDVLYLYGYDDRTEAEFQESFLTYMQDHDVASDLTAVENGDVYQGGGFYQGPITNLVLTERAAQQLYGLADELYDRQRVVDIINGEF